MANIKDLKKRIKSTKQTLKITKAMKLISAAKMAKAQDAVLQARPYSQEMWKTIGLLTRQKPDYKHCYLKKNNSEKILLLVVSSNKGLCGGYNSQLAKSVNEFLKQHSSHDITMVNIGKKVRELAKRTVELGTLYTFKKSDPTHQEISDLSFELADQFRNEKYGKLIIAYNEFISAIKFQPTLKTVLPMVVEHTESVKKHEEKNVLTHDFKYDIDSHELLDELIPQAFLSHIYTAILDALAAEHGARMAAMDSASKNCSEQIRKFTLVMNKLRQAEITTELIEVVSGAEALNG
jgi:F-type H+-transporting ATPase subunit gamma